MNAKAMRLAHVLTTSLGYAIGAPKQVWSNEDNFITAPTGVHT